MDLHKNALMVGHIQASGVYQLQGEMEGQWVDLSHVLLTFIIPEYSPSAPGTFFIILLLLIVVQSTVKPD